MGETILAKIAYFLSKIVYYLLSLLTKNVLVFGGWLATLFILITKEDKISREELKHRMAASIISVPFSMAVDSYYPLNKWSLCTLVIFSGYFMWYILRRFNKVIDRKMDDI